MASTGAKLPTAVVTAAESPWLDDDWVNPANVYGAGDASVTATSFDAGDQTYVLKAYTFDMSAIPAGALIDGVVCVVNARYATALASIDLVQLLDVNRGKVGTNLAATPQALTTSAADYTFGASTSNWGNALTAAWVKDADFGVALGCLAGGSGNNNVDVYIDSVTLNVYYTPVTTVTLGAAALSATPQVVSIAAGAVSVTTGAAALSATPQAVSVASQTTVTLAAAGISATGQAVTIAEFSPATSVLDAFTRADENPLSSADWGGSMWATEATWRVVSNQAAPTDPLMVSDNGRYLVDSKGDPFLIVGDTPWSLISQGTTRDMDTYYADRSARGFNAVFMFLIDNEFCTSPPNNIYGDAPFTGANFTTPNEDYFAHADRAVTKAAALGIYVMLAPLYLGWDAAQGWSAEITAAGDSDMTAWGEYCGNRYKDYDNIIWCIGGDRAPGDLLAKVNTFVAGLRTYDTRHLITFHDGRGSMGKDNLAGATWLTLNSTYTNYLDTAGKANTAYAASPTQPFVQIEANYENDNSITAQGLRAQAYWTILAGGCGHFFGNTPLWGFGYDSADWEAELSKAGSVSMTHLGGFFNAIAWYTLVPDTSHTVLTVGYGTLGTADYAPCAKDAGGSLAVIYMPSNRSMTVDCTEFSGTFTCRWYDPSDGSYSTDAASPHTNSGTHDFSHAGANAAGAADWVLLLEVA